MAGGSEFDPFQMEDGQVVVVGGHGDQAVLDSVELINLKSSGVSAAGLSEGNLKQNVIKVTEMPTTGSHIPLWGGSCWLQDGSLLVSGWNQGLTSR